ncbi:hypothetical protein PCE1_000887 [Barthelona sp. PCE]
MYEIHPEGVMPRNVKNGVYGTVFQVYIDNKRFAVKRQRRFNPLIPVQEVEILSQLEHDNIVSVKEHIITQSLDGAVFFSNLIMEYMPMTLLDYVSRMHPLSLEKIKSITFQIFTTLDYLHENNIMHRDIKPSNILYNPHINQVKICDFGQAKRVGQSFNQSYVCARFYRAPELILGIETGKCNDVWSAGCVMGTLIVGYHIFAGNDTPSQLTMITSLLGMSGAVARYVTGEGKAIMPKVSFYKALKKRNPNITFETVQFLKRVLDTNYTTRPTAHLISRDWFFTE